LETFFKKGINSYYVMVLKKMKELKSVFLHEYLEYLSKSTKLDNQYCQEKYKHFSKEEQKQTTHI
jgi:hypothetical protein